MTSPAFSNTSARVRKTTDKHAQPQHICMINSQVRSPTPKLSEIPNKSHPNGIETMKPTSCPLISPRTWSHLPRGPWPICLVLSLATVPPHGSPSLIPVPDPCYSSACLAAQPVFAEFGLIWEYFK